MSIETQNTGEEMERYASLNVWSGVLGVSSKAIESRMQSVKGITAKLFDGRIRKNCFYAESLIREKCADLLQDLPRANENGIIILNEKKYSTSESWAKFFDVSSTTINRKIKQRNLQGISGFDNHGKLHENRFFEEGVVRVLIADLINSSLIANDDGFIEIDNDLFNTAFGWSRHLKIPNSTLNRLIKAKGLVGRQAKDKLGVPRKNFFSQSVIQEICVDLPKDLFRADSSGFFTQEDERYGTCEAWGRFFNITPESIMARCRKHIIGGIDGKDNQGKLRKKSFISEKNIRSVCNDLIQTDLPKANEEGFIVIEGKKYGTVESWSRVLNISTPTILSRTRHADIQRKNGRDSRGRPLRNGFISEEDINILCGSLLQELPQANSEGFFQYNDETYGNLPGWSNYLKIQKDSIKRRILSSGCVGITGRDCRKRIQKESFYSRKTIENVCSELLSLHLNHEH